MVRLGLLNPDRIVNESQGLFWRFLESEFVEPARLVSGWLRLFVFR